MHRVQFARTSGLGTALYLPLACEWQTAGPPSLPCRPVSALAGDDRMMRLLARLPAMTLCTGWEADDLQEHWAGEATRRIFGAVVGAVPL
jgi:hypothetical protein